MRMKAEEVVDQVANEHFEELPNIAYELRFFCLFYQNDLCMCDISVIYIYVSNTYQRFKYH